MDLIEYIKKNTTFINDRKHVYVDFEDLQYFIKGIKDYSITMQKDSYLMITPFYFTSNHAFSEFDSYMFYAKFAENPTEQEKVELRAGRYLKEDYQKLLDEEAIRKSEVLIDYNDSEGLWQALNEYFDLLTQKILPAVYSDLLKDGHIYSGEPIQPALGYFCFEILCGQNDEKIDLK